SREDMSMQSRLEVAEYRIVDAHCRGALEQRIADERHVAEKLRPPVELERIQLIHHRIRKQQAVPGKHLSFTHHHPAGAQLRDDRGELARPAALHHAVDRGRGYTCRSHSPNHPALWQQLPPIPAAPRCRNASADRSTMLPYRPPSSTRTAASWLRSDRPA